MRPPKLGGRSKKELLGSVADSWVPIVYTGVSRAYGRFEIEKDPPSRSTSPFKAILQVGDIPEKLNDVDAKAEALQRARAARIWTRRERQVTSLRLTRA